MKRRLIICIDGGGIRGVVPLVVLRTLQSRLKRDLRHLASDWYGTSTGAVIAAGLLIQNQIEFGTAIQNVLDVYEFRSNSSINPLGAANPARAFNKLMDENFGNIQLADFPMFHALACELPSLQVREFHQDSLPLSVVLKASCAVPGLFDPVQIADKAYVDGFLKAKNPATVFLNSPPEKGSIILSLGTGILRETDEVERQVRQTHLDLQASGMHHGFHYFRFNPELAEAADSMQDTRLKNIFALKKDTDTYLKQKADQLTELIQLLEAV